jgi:sulfur relay (sulfurtransferase) complex TusBCD TusD component (DsrE family)
MKNSVSLYNVRTMPGKLYNEKNSIAMLNKKLHLCRTAVLRRGIRAWRRGDCINRE